MTPAQRNRVRALFEELVDLPPGDVWERLEAASEPAVVKDEVRSLLEHHARAGSFLTAPASAASLEHELAPGMRLDRYTVVREIGRGGMGRGRGGNGGKWGGGEHGEGEKNRFGRKIVFNLHTRRPKDSHRGLPVFPSQQFISC